ncbi:hypothetical protein JSE7799_02483 [Jannaschia seosinensis]|uniref:YrhK domain-containing protein n=1 Tax=Jannaschia seosinensis TaxID=313367 RepID=A0A0M7BEG8_9RHOB|nr:YrhK family protein [Jannaschia seosinensis]CUH39755.1 hypothetical protein JSE7799_02483 [Jannaschia seosinensis]
MKYFKHENRQRTERTRKIYAVTELIGTATDFFAAMSFFAGSVMFFWKALEPWAISLFVVGSILFAAKPTLRFAREVKLAAEGDTKDLAEREES